MSESKTFVPKFTSFKPKPAHVTEEQKPLKRHEHTSKGKDESAAPEDRRSEDRRHRHHHRSRSQERGLKHKPVLQEPANPPPPSRDEPPEIFIVDRKGDVNNLVYGSIHRYSVPPFRRFGAGHVLGASPNAKIDRNYSDDKGMVLGIHMNSRSKVRERYIFSKIEREKPRRLKIRSDFDVPALTQQDFVPLKSARRKPKSGIEDGDDLEEDGTNYRSIYGKVKSNPQPIDDDLQYATDSDTSGSDTGRAIKLDELTRQKTVELSGKVEQNPYDIDAWLSLIEHQDKLIHADDDQRRVTNAELRSTADIKIHMYEKALEKAKSLEDRERLLLGLMNEGSKLWEIQYQNDKWEEISKNNIDSLLLWKSYLDHRQTTFSTFRYEVVKDVFVNRIKLLSGSIDSVSSDKVESLYIQLLYILLRLTMFIRESAYSEQAVGIWQAFLEFNIFAPSLATKSDKATLFKEFWDSEVPRIGEENSRGWSHFVGNQDLSEPPDPLTDETVDFKRGQPLFEDWAMSERLRARSSRMPARTMDKVTEDDPFRVILYTDIEGYLFSLPPDSPKLYRYLVNAFLLFCRLSPVEGLGKGEWPSDPFLKGGILEYNTSKVQEQLSPDLEDGTENDISSIFKGPPSRFIASSESMFSRSWFSSFETWQTYYSGDDGPVPYNWLRTALHQLARTCFNEDLGEYYLAFEWRNEPDTIKKVSKALLKQNPSSLKLYNAYGMIEWSRGNKKAAADVFSSALNMSKVMPDNIGRDSILLWKSWIWASLEDGDNDNALHQLLSIPDGVPSHPISPSPARFWRAKQFLLSSRDFLLSAGDAMHAVIYAECHALLEYLSSKSATETQSNVQGNISSALAALDNFSQVLQDRGLASSKPHELFLQSAARLLYHHARIGSFRPALLRQYLTDFLTLFPQNTILLSLYTFNESRLRIENRVRSMLSSQHNDLTSRLFTIRYEISRGTIHSARSAFEHAVSSPATKVSAGLWRLYFLYCLQTPQFRSIAEYVWYRAIRACPWAKELYIMGLETLEPLVEFGELKATWRVMGEKELRVHVDLEDVFDEIGELENDNAKAKVRKLDFK